MSVGRHLGGPGVQFLAGQGIIGGSGGWQQNRQPSGSLAFLPRRGQAYSRAMNRARRRHECRRSRRRRPRHNIRHQAQRAAPSVSQRPPSWRRSPDLPCRYVPKPASELPTRKDPGRAALYPIFAGGREFSHLDVAARNSTSTRNSPLAGTVGPAWERCLAAKMRPMSSAAKLPRPTSNSVPTMLRTMR